MFSGGMLASCRPAVPPCLPRTLSHLPSSQAEGLASQWPDFVADLDIVCGPAATHPNPPDSRALLGRSACRHIAERHFPTNRGTS